MERSITKLWQRRRNVVHLGITLEIQVAAFKEVKKLVAGWIEEECIFLSKTGDVIAGYVKMITE